MGALTEQSATLALDVNTSKSKVLALDGININISVNNTTHKKRALLHTFGEEK